MSNSFSVAACICLAFALASVGYGEEAARMESDRQLLARAIRAVNQTKDQDIEALIFGLGSDHMLSRAELAILSDREWTEMTGHANNEGKYDLRSMCSFTLSCMDYHSIRAPLSKWVDALPKDVFKEHGWIQSPASARALEITIITRKFYRRHLLRNGWSGNGDAKIYFRFGRSGESADYLVGEIVRKDIPDGLKVKDGDLFVTDKNLSAIIKSMDSVVLSLLLDDEEQR